MPLSIVTESKVTGLWEQSSCPWAGLFIGNLPEWRWTDSNLHLALFVF
jgi:hypothetical protein